MDRLTPCLLAAAALSCAGGDRRPGEPCEVYGDCAPGGICAVVDIQDGVERTACVALCERGATRCETGEVCWVAGDDPDVWGCFPGNDTPVGGSCRYFVGCERGAICTFDHPPDVDSIGTCTAHCELFGCGAGEHCSHRSDCAEGLECGVVGATGTAADLECVAGCTSPDPDAQQPSLCPDGSLCYLLCDGCETWGCYPGGVTPVGERCEWIAECERGSMCFGGECVRACADDAGCPAGRCVGGLCTA